MQDACEFLDKFDTEFARDHNLEKGKDMQSYAEVDGFDDATGMLISIGVESGFKTQEIAEMYICELRRQLLSAPAVNFLLSHKDDDLFAAEYPGEDWWALEGPEQFPFQVGWYLDCENK